MDSSAERRLAARTRLFERLQPYAAHDLRGRLGTLLLQLELLRQDSKQSDSEALQQRTESLLAVSERLRGSAELFLAQCAPPDVEAADLGALVSRVARWVEPVARERGVGIESPAPGRSTTISDPRGEVRQALTHLLLRAVEVARPGSMVAITLEDPERHTLRIRAEGVSGPDDSGAEGNLGAARDCLSAAGGRLTIAGQTPWDVLVELPQSGNE